MEKKVSKECKALQSTTECSLKKGQNHKFRKKIEKGREYKDR